MRILCTLVVLTFGSLHAICANGTDAFIKERMQRLQVEYQACSGDTTPLPLDSLLRWKNAINDFVNSPAFPRKQKEFADMTGIRTPINNCDLFVWIKALGASAALEEERVKIAEILYKDQVADSIAQEQEIRSNPSSPFDFHRCCFGIKRSTLTHILQEMFPGKSLIENQNTILVEQVPLTNETYTIQFYFDKEGIYYRYDLQSRAWGSDSVDRSVRSEAQKLTQYFQEKAGPPERINRIGFYDIIAGRLALYATWHTYSVIAQIGLGMSKYHYYVKAVILDQQLNEEVLRANKKRPTKQ